MIPRNSIEITKIRQTKFGLDPTSLHVTQLHIGLLCLLLFTLLSPALWTLDSGQTWPGQADQDRVTNLSGTVTAVFLDS